MRQRIWNKEECQRLADRNSGSGRKEIDRKHPAVCLFNKQAAGLSLISEVDMETERLCVRRFSPDDWHDLFEYLS
jgi:hypothetical protein